MNPSLQNILSLNDSLVRLSLDTQLFLHLPLNVVVVILRPCCLLIGLIIWVALQKKQMIVWIDWLNLEQKRWFILNSSKVNPPKLCLSLNLPCLPRIYEFMIFSLPIQVILSYPHYSFTCPWCLMMTSLFYLSIFQMSLQILNR